MSEQATRPVVTTVIDGLHFAECLRWREASSTSPTCTATRCRATTPRPVGERPW